MNAVNVRQDTVLFRKILRTLNEAQRRWFAGREELRRGRGGIQRMVEESGLSKPTILKGVRELRSQRELVSCVNRSNRPHRNSSRKRFKIGRLAG
jgi:hypothetical protein